MHRTYIAYRVIRDAPTTRPLPPLVPYVRCKCGWCRACLDNAKWDRVFAKFETKEREERGVFQSALNDL